MRYGMYELRGTVVGIGPVGETKAGVRMQEVVVEDRRAMRRRRTILCFFGETYAQAIASLHVGDGVVCGFNLDVREHNGRLYNMVVACSIEDPRAAAPEAGKEAADADAAPF